MDQLQVEEFGEGVEMSVPAVVRLPGTTVRLNTVSVAAITGRRFLAGLALPTAASSTPAQPASSKTLGPCRANCKRSRDDNGIGTQSTVTKACHAADSAGTSIEYAAAGRGMEVLAAVISCKAPSELAAADIVALFDAVKSSTSDWLMTQLPGYIQPFLTLAPMKMVRCKRLCLV
jgi:hypothetical protein